MSIDMAFALGVAFGVVMTTLSVGLYMLWSK